LESVTETFYKTKVFVSIKKNTVRFHPLYYCYCGVWEREIATKKVAVYFLFWWRQSDETEKQENYKKIWCFFLMVIKRIV